MKLFVLVTSLVLLLVTVPTTIGADAPNPPPLRTRIDLDAPSGAVVLHVTNPTGIAAVTGSEMRFQTDNVQRLQVNVVLADGTILLADALGANGDFAGEGDGTVYAGRGSLAAESGNLTANEEVDTGGGIHLSLDRWGATEAWIVTWWTGFDHLPDAADDSFYSYDWRPGTIVTRVHEGQAETFEMKDFRHGARAGALAPIVPFGNGVRVHAGDYLDFSADGGILLGVSHFVRSPYVAHGGLDLGGDVDKLIDLHAEPDSSLGFPACFCIEIGDAFFTTTSDLRASLDYVGEGRNAYVDLTVIRLPAGSIPSGAWTEMVLHPVSGFTVVHE